MGLYGRQLKILDLDRMMEFWPEQQGHSSLYARFGTVPRRNCAHTYHDRHQTTSYPFSYGEQQGQGRESGYWTVPSLRTGRSQQDSANWTHSELAAPSSSHFPFNLDRQTQQHQDIGVYEPYEVRGREWTAAQRDYERGFQRERWQRIWEPSSPVRYKREVSTKRSNNSYQGLESWAAQYSHSLPRRKNREEELRCTPHSLLESSGATERNRSGINPQVSLLQHVRQSADGNKSGAVWDRRQTLTCHPLQVPASDTSHTLDIIEKAGYQRRMFSHPPGYTAPPPYNSPHKCSPVMQHSNTNREQGGQRQTYWSQPTIKKQDISNLQDKNKREKEELTNRDGNQTCAQLEGLQHRTPGSDALKAGSPITVQDIQQHPQIIQSVQNTKATEQTSSKVIEGKKFWLNKKTGGMTIFCLVSRIADITQTPSRPLCTSQANIQSSEFTEVSEGQRDSGDILQTQKFADEVDFRAAASTEQSTSDTRNITTNVKTIPTGIDSLETETGISPENNNLNGSTFGRQVAQCAHPVPVKYPLWREPSFTSRAETENPSSFLKADHKEEESGGLHSQEKSATAHPINVEVRRLDIKRDTQSEDSESLLVIDTTCVVVKMELIPPPKKDHVHYLSSTVHTGENPLHIQSSNVPKSNSLLTNEQDSDMEMKLASEGGGDLSFTCKPSSSFSERETLVECSDRIPGIPLHGSITEEQSEEAPSFLDLCVMDEPLSVTNDNHDRTGQLPDTKEDHLVTCQNEDDAEDQVQNEDGEHFAGPQEQVSALCEEMDNNSKLEANVQTSKETKKTEDRQLEPTDEEGTTEENGEENQLVTNDPSLQHPYPCECLSKSSFLSHSNLTSLSYISQLTTEEDLDVVALNLAENLAPCPETSSLPEATSYRQPSPLLPGSTKSSPSSTPHKCHSPRPSPELIDQLMEPISGIEDKDDKNESSELVNDESSDASKNREEQEVVSQQQFEFEKSDNDTCGEEKSNNDTCGEEKSNNDTCGEEKSNNDTCGEEKSDNDTCGEEKSDNDTCGEEKSDNDTCGEEKSENYTCGEEKSDNDTCGEEKSNNDTCEEEKSDNDTCGEENSDNDTCGEEKSDNDTCGEEKSDNDTCGEEKSDNDTLKKRNQTMILVEKKQQ
ncbi:hypothetical protein JOB18_047826 [Solea senegalensis]|uniref:Uncharacterized protein n=1 Tax=Solea senegalensis TaxID=28829 RepID=A0AAV6QNZ1_SOLSE|nr:hypothetical protein JOB18_047826 [Solea senegalensis]